MRRAWHLTDGVVDMRSKRLSAGIAVEERWENMPRERGRRKKRITPKSSENDFAQLARDWMSFGDLDVVLGFGRLVTGCHLAIDPLGLVEQFATLGDLLRSQNIWNAD